MPLDKIAIQPVVVSGRVTSCPNGKNNTRHRIAKLQILFCRLTSADPRLSARSLDITVYNIAQSIEPKHKSSPFRLPICNVSSSSSNSPARSPATAKAKGIDVAL